MKLLKNRFATPLAGSILCYFATGVAPVFAQQSADGGLEQIVVTARKQQENLLDTPVTVSVLTSEALEIRSINSLSSVADFTPGLKLDPTLNSRNDRSQQTLIIRGMTPTFNGNVSIFIDGAPIVGSGFAEGIEDLQRVEVVKGPQSADFGRSVFAGAVNLVTKDPSATDYHASLEASVSTYSGHDVQGSVEGPLVQDKLALRIEGRDYRTDGSYKNAADPGETMGAQRTDSINASLKFTPTDNLSVKLFGEYFTQDDGSGTAYKLYNIDYNCAAGAKGATLNYTCGQLPSVNLGRLAVNDEITPAVSNVILHNSTGKLLYLPGMSTDFANHAGLERHDYHLHGIVAYDIPAIDATFTSTTSYDRDRYEVLIDVANQDTSGIPNPNFNTTTLQSLQPFVNFFLYNQNDIKGYSQDFRLQSNGHSRFHWSVGGSFYHQWSAAQVGALEAIGPVNFQAPTATATGTLSGYFSAGYDILSNLTVSFEGRYQNDKQYLNNFTAATQTFFQTTQESQNNFIPRALVQYHPLQNVMVYASYSEGVNPGGFNSNLISYSPAIQQQIASTYNVQLQILPEKLKNFELGVKTELLDGKAQVTADVYHANWVNQVVTAQIAISNIAGIAPGTLFTDSQNVGRTEFNGFEIQGTVVPTKGLTVDGGFAYTPGTIKQYICAICAINVTGNTNVNGHHLPSVSATTANLGVEYKAPITTGLDGFGRIDWTYQGKIYEDETNLAWIPGSSKVNLRAGVQRGNITVEGYVTNLFDNTSWTDVQRNSDLVFGGNDVILGLPVRRTFGLRFRASI